MTWDGEDELATCLKSSGESAIVFCLGKALEMPDKSTAQSLSERLIRQQHCNYSSAVEQSFQETLCNYLFWVY